jgi:nucleoid-associated protein YgaU
MSVMSAAEARQAAGASPEIPPQPLLIARSAAGQEDAAAAGNRLDAGSTTSAEPGLTGRSASALRVTHVRMVREVRVSTLRAEGHQPGIVPLPRAAAQAAATAPRTRVAAQAAATAPRTRVAAQARAAMQAEVATHARVSDQSGTASQIQAASRARKISQVRMTRQARVASRPVAVRLTRRGRRVVAAFVIGVVIVAVTLLWMSVAGSVQASSHGSALGSPYRGMTQVVVRPGQTLWSIAAAAEPSGNVWGVVQQIINVNALSSANVQAGQLLWVPGN